MNSENVEIGLRIRKLREKNGLSREKLAELSSISTQFLADIETGKKGMTVTTLKKICNALNISTDYIVYGNNNVNLNGIAQIMSDMDNEKQQKIKNIFKEIIEL